MIDMNEDAVRALADLAGRCGASGLDIGYLHDDVPVEQASWYASVSFQGSRIMTENQTSPSTAALALAERILSGGMCKCGRMVVMSGPDRADIFSGRLAVCRWRLMGARWEPGCDVPSIVVKAAAGDVSAMRQAFAERYRWPA